MEFTQLAAFWQSLTTPASRRGVLAALGGLLTAGPLALGLEEAAARKRGNRRKNRRKNKNKNKTKQRKNQKPETRTDATCPESGGFSLSNPDGNNRFAQTFTANASGPLVSAELQISKRADSSGDFVLRLSPLDGSGIPTNDVLAEAIVADADVSEEASAVPFSFASPFSVKAGNEYALVLTRGEGVFGWSARGGYACLGTAFQSPDQTAPFDESGFDFIFTAFVRS
jgi:hypothetical protein